MSFSSALRTLGLATTIALPLTATSSNATTATLFSDNFNRTSSLTVGNGWQELGKHADDAAIAHGRLVLKDDRDLQPDVAVVSPTISTSGYQNIKVSFRWLGFTSNEYTDRLRLGWSTFSTATITNVAGWTQVFNGGNGGGRWNEQTVTLSPAANNTAIRLFIWGDIDTPFLATEEGFDIDDITVIGTAIPPTFTPPTTPPTTPPLTQAPAIPLPAGLPLLIGGLAAFGALRRRKG